ncbi:MAG: hypothetical protein LLG04_05315 [Parachlamydia sp.]|nr:hypothetical protein [Parachlamydia sp.]
MSINLGASPSITVATAAPQAVHSVPNDAFHLAPTAHDAIWMGKKHLKEKGNAPRTAHFQVLCSISEETIKLVGRIRLSASTKEEYAGITFKVDKHKTLATKDIIPKFLQHPGDFTVVIEPAPVLATLPYQMTISNNLEFPLLTVSPSAYIFTSPKKRNIHFFSFENVKEFALLAQNRNTDVIANLLTQMATTFANRISTNPLEVKEILEVFPALITAHKRSVLTHLVQLMRDNFTIEISHANALKDIFDYFQAFTTAGHISVGPEKIDETKVDEWLTAQKLVIAPHDEGT